MVIPITYINLHIFYNKIFLSLLTSDFMRRNKGFTEMYVEMKIWKQQESCQL
jgi:hypothetical protein